MHRLLLLVIVGVTASGSALAASPFQGTYAFTGTSSCIQVSASIGFNSNFLPNGASSFFSYTVTGTRTFASNGTGTATGTVVSIGAPPNDAGASSANFSFKFTYTIDPSGMISTAYVPNSFAGTVLTGTRATQTFDNPIPPITGQVGQNPNTIVLTEPGPAIETVTFSDGAVFNRICTRERVLILTSPKG
jgi:hypothetical protein